MTRVGCFIQMDTWQTLEVDIKGIIRRLLRSLLIITCTKYIRYMFDPVSSVLITFAFRTPSRLIGSTTAVEEVLQIALSYIQYTYI